jgi:HK97 family phage prohead protease
MTIDRNQFGLEVKFAGGDQADGTFSGYGSIFGNEDHGGDVILKGAFRDTLRDWKAKGKLPKMLLQHGGFFGGVADMVPIGKWTAMEEDSKGLAVEGKLLALDSDLMKRVYPAMKEGELDGMSIGYRAKEFALGTKPGEPYRTIKRLDLLEVSVVLFGMNDQALVEDVKTEIDDLKTLSDAEKFLREAGNFSRKNATAFVSRLARIAQREAGASKALDRLLEQMRSINGRP